MPPHSTLRIRTPPSDHDEVNYTEISYMNIIFMLVLASFLHMAAFCVTRDEIFFWIGVMFTCMSMFVICVSINRR